MLALLYALGHVALILGYQTPLESPQTILQTSGLDVTAPFIFNSLSGLLTQWPNTVHGHSIVPGILHPFTLLYHARQDSQLPPPSPEWLAWDPEMSYAIMVSRGGQSHLTTYRTTRPAKIIYLDGMSAAWGSGWLDSQHMFIYGMSKNRSKDISMRDDYGRADKLCEWAKSRDVEGFVRMNAGFEIIWCDFESPSLQLVSHLNITPPGTPERPSSWPRFPGRNLTPMELGTETLDDPPDRPPRRGPGGGDPPRRGPGRGGGGPWQPPISDLALTGNLEWVRAASHRAFAPQPHLTLFYSDMVTFYHPSLTSLVRDRLEQPMRSHRLVNISSDDAQKVVSEVDSVLARRAAGELGTNFDWGTTARSIVEYWGDRISHMHTYLLNASDPSVNTTASLPVIRTLAYTPINPFMQPGITPNASGWDLFFALPTAFLPNAFVPNTNVTALERCTSQATGFLSQMQMTPQERLLRTSVESVLARLCNDFGVIFAQSSDLVATNSLAADPRSLVRQWTRRIEDLMEWLDWTVWMRCEDVCPLDHVCSVPMWPIAWTGRWDSNDVDSLKPRCMRMAV